MIGLRFLILAWAIPLFLYQFAFGYSGASFSLPAQLIQQQKGNSDAKSDPITCEQIENILKGKTTGHAFAKEIEGFLISQIEQRGLAFKVDTKVLTYLKNKLNASDNTIHALKKAASKDKAATCVKSIVLLSDFQSATGEKRDVTEFIKRALDKEAEAYPSIEIQSLGETITVNQGREVALAKARERKADVVLWGWYSVNQEQVYIEANLEALHSPAYGLLKESRVIQESTAKLNGFQIQLQLGKEMSHLTLLALALTNIAAGDNDHAIKLLTQVLQGQFVPIQHNRLAKIYFFRGLAYHRRGAAVGLGTDYEKAEADFTKAIESDPDVAIASLSYISRGIIKMDNGNSDSALADFSKAIEIFPQFGGGYMYRGRFYEAKGEFAQALKDFDKIVEVGHDTAFGYTERARFHITQRRYDEDFAKKALADAKRAIELDPNNVDGHYYLALAYIWIGQPSNATTEITKVIDLDPSNWHAYILRASLYSSARQIDRAIEECNNVIKLRPDYVDGHNKLADLYKEKRQYDLALSKYAEVIRRDPAYVSAYYDRAMIFAGMKQDDKMFAEFAEGLKANPQSSSLYYWRAHLYKERGRKTEAISDFKKVLELSGDAFEKELVKIELEELQKK